MSDNKDYVMLKVPNVDFIRTRYAPDPSIITRIRMDMLDTYKEDAQAELKQVKQEAYAQGQIDTGKVGEKYSESRLKEYIENYKPKGWKEKIGACMAIPFQLHKIIELGKKCQVVQDAIYEYAVISLTKEN